MVPLQALRSTVFFSFHIFIFVYYCTTESSFQSNIIYVKYNYILKFIPNISSVANSIIILKTGGKVHKNTK